MGLTTEATDSGFARVLMVLKFGQIIKVFIEVVVEEFRLKDTNTPISKE